MKTQISQNTEKYLIECAEIFLKFRQFGKAREVYAELLKKDVRHTVALKGLGICLYREKNWQAARKCFLAYSQLSGELDGKVWLNSCYLMSGEIEVAQMFFQKNLKSELDLMDYKHLSNIIPTDVLDSLKGIIETPEPK